MGSELITAVKKFYSTGPLGRTFDIISSSFHGAKTLSKTTLIITTLSTTLRKVVTGYAECLNAKCHCVDSHNLAVTLSVIVQTVII